MLSVNVVFCFVLFCLFYARKSSEGGFGNIFKIAMVVVLSDESTKGSK